MSRNIAGEGQQIEMTLRWIFLAVVTFSVSAGADSDVTTAATPVATSALVPPPPSDSCGATRVSVVSRQNSSGHWLGDARVERAVLPGRPLNPLTVSLSHERRRSADSNTIVMQLHMEGLLEPVREDYFFYQGLGYYKVHYEKATWVKAKTICENEGAHLVILNSEEEAELMKKIVPSLGGVLLVGIHDMFIEGHYMTVLGEPLESTGYIKWGAKEPNGKTGENCVNIYGGGEMNDLPCDGRSYSFVCEHPQK